MYDTADLEERISCIRRDTCVSHLISVAHEYRHLSAHQDVVRELALGDVFSLSREETSTSVGPVDGALSWTGVLPEKDLLRFGVGSRTELEPAFQTKLEEDLDALMVSVSDFLHADADSSQAERQKRTWSLPDHISSRQGQLATTQTALEGAYRRIESMTEKATQSHIDLRASLLEMVSRYAGITSGKRSAMNELLAATIEISLIKLSLVRARAHRALYEFKSAGQSVGDALSAAHGRLKREERKMGEEEEVLDGELGEYEMMVGMVDGGGGGFGQVVDDWTRVEREKEECRRDLRRLGWTGD